MPANLRTEKLANKGLLLNRAKRPQAQGYVELTHNGDI